MSTPNTQVAETKPKGLKALINSTTIREQFAMALPKHLSPDRFVRVATTALLRTPSLVDCTPESFMKCLMELSAWGIEPDGRRAHLIPFKRKFKRPDGTWGEALDCQLILDWKGLAELAQRSGQIAKLHADLICENDSFVYNLGEIQEHRIDFRHPRGKPYAAYAMAVTKDGATYVAVLTEDEIMSIRNGSQGWTAFEKGFAKQSPWDPKNPTSEGEMWKKTAFRRLSKWLPLSPEFRDAIEREDEIEPEPRNATGRVVTDNPMVNPYLAATDRLPAGVPEGYVAVEPTDEAEPVPEPSLEPVMQSPVEVSEPTEIECLIQAIRDWANEHDVKPVDLSKKARALGLIPAGKQLADLDAESLRVIESNSLAIWEGTYQPA